MGLAEIADFTLQQWGLEQTRRYPDSLERCFGRIAANPEIGRRCDLLKKGYRRIEHEKHVIFYRLAPEGILVVRVLHESMMPDKRSLDEE